VPVSSPRRDGDPHSPRRIILPAVGVSVVVLLLARLLLLDTVVVTSDSMRPGLEPGDRLLVLRTAGIERGDVIVLDGSRLLGQGADAGSRTGGALSRLLGTDAGSAYVKRVIGVPGDRVACCDEQGRIEVDGTPVEEPYVTGPTDQVPFDVTVPDDRLWVLGDNRSDSADSRSALGRPGGGMLRADEVLGEVVWRYWPRVRWGDPAAGPMSPASEPFAAQTASLAVSRMGDTAERHPSAVRAAAPADTRHNESKEPPP
jgi:signal peptidase I